MSLDEILGAQLGCLTRLMFPEKQEKPSIVELKNGKVYFRQKPLSFEKQSETLQGVCFAYLTFWQAYSSISIPEIVRFRAMLEERISNRESPLLSFPKEHKPLIAKLAHERSVRLM